MSDEQVTQNGNDSPEAAQQATALEAEEQEQVPAAAEAVADVVEAQEMEGAVAAEPEGQTESEEELSLEERVERAEAQAAEYLDGWQRARAEFANARKRMEKNRIDARRTATVEVIGRLLPILDDFERALENVPETVAENSWIDGVYLVERKLRGILDAENIERIEAVGQPFDPNLHEAVMQEETEEHESGTVIKELQAGYRLKDRVIRPAMVVVAA